MENNKNIRTLDTDELNSVRGGAGHLGVYRTGLRHKKESLEFFKACVGDEIYEKAMKSEAGREHHYTVARAFLSQKDWEKFVWIEEFGSLDGFPKT